MSKDNNNDNAFHVRVSYKIENSEKNDEVITETFHSTEPARIGLPIGMKPIKSNPGDYNYSGSHDTGPLIPPKEGGTIACLIASIQQAKQYNDTYLTSIIEKEKEKLQQQKEKNNNDNNNNNNNSPSHKKVKTNK